MSRKQRGGRRDVHPEGRLRDEILDQLDRVEAGAWADRLSPGALFSADDRRRITEYVGGITRLRRRMDFLIDSFSSRSRPIDPTVRQILRIGVYELTVLERAPHASVFASVEQAKRRAPRGAANFVNGVLRAVSRQIDSLPAPNTGDRVVDAAISLSHPDWMARRWVQGFGPEVAEALMAYNNRRPVYSLRVNTLRTSPEDFRRTLADIDVEAVSSPYLPEFVRVTQLQPIIAAGFLRSGLAAVQDESAGLVSRVLNPRPGEYIIDTCAAPGGKSIHAGILMENQGRIVGIDPNGRRLAAAAQAARSHGLDIVEILEADFRTLESSPTLSPADAVLLDAPCSGLGVLSRRPDLRWRKDENSIRELTSLQDQLLDTATLFVKPGGRLTYATCTITDEENHERIEAFLGRHPDFSLGPIGDELPSDVVDGGCLRTLPHVHGIDGAFAARLIRG